jgi:hypothetical protein
MFLPPAFFFCPCIKTAAPVFHAAIGKMPSSDNRRLGRCRFIFYSVVELRSAIELRSVIEL